MNKAGLPLVDNFAAEPLAPLVSDFVLGAQFVYGHTVMQRALGFGYESDWAKAQFKTRRERNAFYTAVGAKVKPGGKGWQEVASWDANKLAPGSILEKLGL